MKRMLVLLAALLLVCGLAGAEGSATCRVWVGDTEISLMDTAVTNLHSWMANPITSLTPVGVLAAEGPFEIAIEFTDIALESAVVRPLSLGIEPEIVDGQVRFSLDAPANVTVEYNGQVTGALHLFITAPDENKPDPEASDVIYFGPGEHDVGIIKPKSGQTIYLDEGCILRGAIQATGVENVRVAGHGIIDGSTYDRWKDIMVPINFENSSHITIEGITILDPAAWTLNLYMDTDVVVNGVKIIGARSNSDGITIQSCENVQVRNCFVRSWDDSLVVKGYDADARDITFENCVLWTDLAQSCEIGYETRADVIERITFRDITVLHNFHKPVLSIHNSDNALIRDILYENIVVEDAQMGEGDGANMLIELTTSKSQWSQTAERGNIRNVLFDGITVLDGKEPGIKIFSFRGEYNIDDVTIRNLSILGKRITSLDELRMSVNKHNGENIVVLAD